jgi:hypothetical protein
LSLLDLSTVPLVIAAGVLLFLGGVVLLRRSWIAKGSGNLPIVIAGWLAIGAACWVFGHVFGAEVGVAYALIVLSLVAYLIVFWGREVRAPKTQKARDAALEPDDRPSNWPRAGAKALLSIVLAGIAAIGAGVAFAVAMPVPVHDRIVIGGVLVPLLWGAGMAWTLSDAKLLRATLVLGSISLVSYGIAFLPKVLP